MDLLGEFASHLAIGINEAVSVSNLWYCFVGVFFGCLIGMLPGLGVLVGVTLLLPITYHLPTTGALIMLAGVYFGADYGGGTSTILLGVPGTPSTAVNVLDGYPMAKKGRGGVALFMKCIASFSGSAVGILLLMLFAPLLTVAALEFGPAEYSALMLLGLVAASTVVRGSPVKGATMMVFGLILGTVGTDINTGVARFFFGLESLRDGVGLLAVTMGIFAISEVILNANRGAIFPVDQKFSLRDQLPTREDWRRCVGPILRGSGLGAFFGALPGTHSGIATWLAYAIEKRLSKKPDRFGKGAIEGVAAPEACNNAGVGTAFIPTLTLGIPGDAVMALMLASLMMHGIQPGPRVIGENPELFWGLIVSFWIGNIFLVILNIPLIGFWVRILSIPYRILFPAIILFTCIGVYSVDKNPFDLYILLLFGVFGFFMRMLKFEMAPLILGLILGPLLEENLKRALVLSEGDFIVFVTSPICALALLLTGLLLAWSTRVYLRGSDVAIRTTGQTERE